MQHAYAKYTNNQEEAVKELAKAVQKNKRLAQLLQVCVMAIVVACLGHGVFDH
jgi:hypothetical protein